jgi:uncharacterized membrane protein YoaK (UPF0700 family)
LIGLPIAQSVRSFEPKVEMPMPTPSDPFDHRLSPSKGSVDVTRLQDLLPPVLSTVAGMVDVISFLNLKLFTAHVTGNLVVIAALLVRGGPPNLAQILAVPVFILAVGGVWVIAKRLNKRGPALARPLLQVQFLLLACVLIVAVVYHPAADPHGLTAGVDAMIAVSAMACQFALLRLAVPGAPSTAVMTGNLTKTTLELLNTLSGSVPEKKEARAQLKKTVQLVAGFFAGCLAGAAAVSSLGEWAWSFPVLLAGVAVAVP